MANSPHETARSCEKNCTWGRKQCGKTCGTEIHIVKIPRKWYATSQAISWNECSINAMEIKLWKGNVLPWCADDDDSLHMLTDCARQIAKQVYHWQAFQQLAMINTLLHCRAVPVYLYPRVYLTRPDSYPQVQVGSGRIDVLQVGYGYIIYGYRYT